MWLIGLISQSFYFEFATLASHHNQMANVHLTWRNYLKKNLYGHKKYLTLRLISSLNNPQNIVKWVFVKI
jgi:hypothetical protein